MNLRFDYEPQLEKLARAPKSARFIAGVCILLLSATTYWFFVYQPKADELARLKTTAEELQRRRSSIRVVVENMAAFEQEVLSLQTELRLALRQLPEGKQFEDLLRDISTTGKKVGVQIKSIKKENEELLAFYARVPFRIEIEGSYHDLARFFENVSHLARIVNVDELKIRVSDESRSNTTLQVEGTATTFRFLSESVELRRS